MGLFDGIIDTVTDVVEDIGGNIRTGGRTLSEPTTPPKPPPAKPDHSGPQGGITREQLEGLLDGLGLRPDVWDNLIDQAQTEGWSTAQFTAAVYASDVFKNHFQGIFYKGGKLKMAPFQYINMRHEYQMQARSYGIHISNEQFGVLMENNVSGTEFSDRLTALQRIKENPAAFKAFGFGAGYDFLLGKSAKEFYDKWDDVQTGAAAYEAGLKDDLNKADIKYIADHVPGFGGAEGGTINEADMAELAANLRENMPLSKLYGLGLSKQMLIEAQFGGPNQDMAKQKLKRLAATVSANINEKPMTTKESEKELNNQTMKGGYGVAGD